MSTLFYRKNVYIGSVEIASNVCNGLRPRECSVVASPSRVRNERRDAYVYKEVE